MNRAAALTLCLAVLGVGTGCSKAELVDRPDVERQVGEINALSESALGVDLFSLSVLVNSPPGTVYSGRAIDFWKMEKAFRILESKGLIVVTRSKTPNGDFVGIERTKSGDELAEMIEAAVD
jgi:hypothetical protein